MAIEVIILYRKRALLSLFTPGRIKLFQKGLLPQVPVLKYSALIENFKFSKANRSGDDYCQKDSLLLIVSKTMGRA